MLKETYRNNSNTKENFRFELVKQGYEKTFRYTYTARNGEAKANAELLGNEGWHVIGTQSTIETKPGNYLTQSQRDHLNIFKKIESEFDKYIDSLYFPVT